MIPPEKLPYPTGLRYRDGVPVVYDSGDYPRALHEAVERLGGLAAFRREQAQAWREGRFLGFGIGCYVEGTGAGPFEGATARVDPSGDIFVATGAWRAILAQLAHFGRQSLVANFEFPCSPQQRPGSNQPSFETRASALVRTRLIDAWI